MGRNLELTETGRIVQNYAEEIFSRGAELEEMLRNLPMERPTIFKVGVVDVVPKSIAYRLLAPALKLDEPVRIVCREGDMESLLAELAVHRVDLVIADGPIPTGVNVRGFNHMLGECGVTFLAVPRLARKLSKKTFPQCLSGEPVLLPGDATAVHSRLLRWFDENRIHPRIIGEFDDSALMKAFGQSGHGVFIAPSSIANEVKKQYGVVEVGKTNDIREQFIAITVGRKITHPAVSAITQTAQEWLVQDTGQKQRKRTRRKT